ncbi:MAG: DUF2283 domain-containing protein [Dehalococcoidia bacterium]
MTSKTRLEYNEEGDVLYVVLHDKQVARSKCVDNLRTIDYGEDGSVVGLEFVSASSGIDLSDMPSSETVAELIGESGQKFPIFA